MYMKSLNRIIIFACGTIVFLFFSLGYISFLDESKQYINLANGITTVSENNVSTVFPTVVSNNVTLEV